MPKYKKKNSNWKKSTKRSKRKKGGLNKTAEKQVKSIIDNKIRAEEEWGSFDPPYHFKASLSGSSMSYSPTQGATTGNTEYLYSSSYGLVTSMNMATHLGDSGIESREGQEITVQRQLVRLTAEANTNYNFRDQQLRIYAVSVPVEVWNQLSDSTAVNTYLNNLLQSLKYPGQVNSDLSPNVKAMRKTYKILDVMKCYPKQSDTSLTFALNKVWNKKVNWKFKYAKTLGTGAVNPLNQYLFYIYKFGGFDQTDSSNRTKDHMPEFDINIQLFYTT